jgi:L-fuculose-phosphate aldolase
MLMEQERKQIVETGKLMYDRGLVQMCGGNISIRDPKTNLVAIKPSGGAYIHMKPEDIIIVDIDGNVVEGEKKPSIETPMHTGIYKARPDIMAIVHCHPLHAVAWSLKRTYLPSVIAAQYMINGAVKVAPYEDAGSAALAKSAVDAIGTDGYACILQAHGVIAGSPYDVFHALEMCYVVEDGCQIAEICETMEGSMFTIDEQLGAAGGYDGLARLRRFSGKA